MVCLSSAQVFFMWAETRGFGPRLAIRGPLRWCPRVTRHCRPQVSAVGLYLLILALNSLPQMTHIFVSSDTDSVLFFIGLESFKVFKRCPSNIVDIESVVWGTDDMRVSNGKLQPVIYNSIVPHSCYFLTTCVRRHSVPWDYLCDGFICAVFHQHLGIGVKAPGPLGLMVLDGKLGLLEPAVRWNRTDTMLVRYPGGEHVSRSPGCHP